MTKKIKVFLFTSGFLILLATIASLFFVNFHFGMIILCSLSFFLILYGLFCDSLLKLKCLNYSILASCVFFAIMMLFLGFYGQTDNVTFDEDAVIVLGAGIRGERVTRLLAYRLDRAAEYSDYNPNAIIVVSGGQGPQEDITEALAMERYLIEKGVPQERIIKEEASTSTYENLLYSKEILDKLFEVPYKVVVITNDFHIFRATKLAEKLGLNVTHYHAKIDMYGIPLNYSRECIAVLRLLILGR